MDWIHVKGFSFHFSSYELDLTGTVLSFTSSETLRLLTFFQFHMGNDMDVWWCSTVHLVGNRRESIAFASNNLTNGNGARPASSYPKRAGLLNYFLFFIFKYSGSHFYTPLLQGLVKACDVGPRECIKTKSHFQPGSPSHGNLICKKKESWSLERRRRGRRRRALFPLLGVHWLETAHLLLQKHYSSFSTIAKWSYSSSRFYFLDHFV